MSDKTAIFIFSKDRPDSLRVTLNSIKKISNKIFIIDDSIKKQNQARNKRISYENRNCLYLGRCEFDNFVEGNRINIFRFSFLLRRPGNFDWNLGYMRNFALLYAKKLNLEKVLFMDDDIQVLSLKTILDLFKLKNKYELVGANITGMVDDSILGHIATDLGIHGEKMLSGGFIVFNPKTIQNYFLNIYNEDWILFFFQLENNKYLQTGEVVHTVKNPYLKYKSKIIFQEFGEIAIEGILKLESNEYSSKLLLTGFWEKILSLRIEYLEELISISLQMDKTNYLKMLKWLKSDYSRFNARSFANLFKEYYIKKPIFLKLYNSLDS